MTTTEVVKVGRHRVRALQAAVELLTQEGWDAITQARVAEESGLGRATVYRYWPRLADLLSDAVRSHMTIAQHHEPTGNLRADLIRELEYLRANLIDRDLGVVLAGLIDRAEWDPELRELKHQIAEAGTLALRSMLKQAVLVGEFPRSVDIDTCVSLLVGPLIYSRLVTDRPVDNRFIRELVDGCLHGYAAGAPRATASGGRR